MVSDILFAGRVCIAGSSKLEMLSLPRRKRVLPFVGEAVGSCVGPRDTTPVKFCWEGEVK